MNATPSTIQMPGWNQILVHCCLCRFGRFQNYDPALLRTMWSTSSSLVKLCRLTTTVCVQKTYVNNFIRGYFITVELRRIDRERPYVIVVAVL